MVSVDKAHPFILGTTCETTNYYFCPFDRALMIGQYTMLPGPMFHMFKFDVFITCPLCEVENYAKFFNLSNEEILQVRQYMRYWSILRQCCGFQQSKRKRQVLHGCGDFSYHIQGALDYHDCFSKNLSAVEHAYVSSLLFEKVLPAPSHLQTTRPSTGKKLEIRIALMSRYKMDWISTRRTPAHVREQPLKNLLPALR